MNCAHFYQRSSHNGLQTPELITNRTTTCVGVSRWVGGCNTKSNWKTITLYQLQTGRRLLATDKMKVIGEEGCPSIVGHNFDNALKTSTLSLIRWTTPHDSNTRCDFIYIYIYIYIYNVSTQVSMVLVHLIRSWGNNIAGIDNKRIVVSIYGLLYRLIHWIDVLIDTLDCCIDWYTGLLYWLIH